MNKTAERPLHEYIVEVSERTDVRIGVLLPLGTHEYKARRAIKNFVR